MKGFAVLVLCLSVGLSVGLPHALRHPTGRIINGEDAADGQFPFMVSIRHIALNYHYCGGSIIDTNWILTAGHCCQEFDVDDSWIQAGSNTLDHGGVTYPIKDIELHPNFTLTNTDLINDICLIKLSKGIEETDKIKVVKLEKSYDDVARDVELSGWGSTVLGGDSPNKLQTLKLKTVRHEECVEAWGDHAYYPIRESQICAFAKNGQGACHGDSGSPLTEKNENGESVVVGLASWVDPCALGLPDIYTRISSYVPWIESVVGHEL